MDGLVAMVGWVTGVRFAYSFSMCVWIHDFSVGALDEYCQLLVRVREIHDVGRDC